jgi:ribosome maturation factor RimP
MAIPVNGRKRFRGRIEAVAWVDSAPCARLRLPGAENGAESSVDLGVKDMAEARLVLTEDLIRATLRREKAAQKEARAARGGASPKPRPSKTSPKRPNEET